MATPSTPPCKAHTTLARRDTVENIKIMNRFGHTFAVSKVTPSCSTKPNWFWSAKAMWARPLLLKALKSEKGEGAPKKDERTTHGVEIDIHGLSCPTRKKKASRSNSMPRILAGRMSTV